MNDALDDILADSDDEEEEQAIVNKVLDEIGIEISGKVGWLIDLTLKKSQFKSSNCSLLKPYLCQLSFAFYMGSKVHSVERKGLLIVGNITWLSYRPNQEQKSETPEIDSLGSSINDVTQTPIVTRFITKALVLSSQNHWPPPR